MILTTSEDILDQMEGEAGSAFDFVTRLMRGSPNKGLKCFFVVFHFLQGLICNCGSHGKSIVKYGLIFKENIFSKIFLLSNMMTKFRTTYHKLNALIKLENFHKKTP